jgi:hypothetical protein
MSIIRKTAINIAIKKEKGESACYRVMYIRILARLQKHFLNKFLATGPAEPHLAFIIRGNVLLISGAAPVTPTEIPAFRNAGALLFNDQRRCLYPAPHTCGSGLSEL